MAEPPVYDVDRSFFEVSKPSRWRWVRRIGVSIAVSLIGYGGCTLVDRSLARRDGERALTAAHSQLDEQDPNWSWDRLVATRQNAPEGKNSAELIPKIKKLTHAEWGKELAKGTWKSRLEVQPNVRYSPSVLKEVRRELTTSADAATLARSLKDYPSGHREIVLKPNVLDTVLQDTQDTRQAADVLRWDVVLATQDGDRSRAADDLLALLNASRSVGDEPFLVSQLVRMAVRAITVKSVEWHLAQTADAVKLKELQAAFTEDAEEPILLYGVRGERAAFDRLFENLDSGTATPAQAIDGSFQGNTWAQFGWWHYLGNLPADRAYALTWLTQCVEFARRPISEQPALFATIPAPPKESARMLSSLLLPAVDRVAHAHWRGVAEVRCAVVGIACERFRQQHKRWPAALTELVPAYLPAVPLDPYTAEPLRFTKLEQGIVIHSVGKDLRGDGGTLDAPPTPSTIYSRFRLWNPEHRHQPPLPEEPAPEQEP